MRVLCVPNLNKRPFLKEALWVTGFADNNIQIRNASHEGTISSPIQS